MEIDKAIETTEAMLADPERRLGGIGVKILENQLLLLKIAAAAAQPPRDVEMELIDSWARAVLPGLMARYNENGYSSDGYIGEAYRLAVGSLETREHFMKKAQPAPNATDLPLCKCGQAAKFMFCEQCVVVHNQKAQLP